MDGNVEKLAAFIAQKLKLNAGDTMTICLTLAAMLHTMLEDKSQGEIIESGQQIYAEIIKEVISQKRS